MALEAYRAYGPRKTCSFKAIWSTIFHCRIPGEFHCVELIYLSMNGTNGKKDIFIFLKLCVNDILYNDQFTYLTFLEFSSSAFRYQNLSHFVQRSRQRMSLSWYWIGFQEDLWLIKRNLNWNSWSVCVYLNSIQTNKHKITFHFRMLEEDPTVTLFRNIRCTFTWYTFCRVGVVTVNRGLKINAVLPYSSSRQCMLVVSTGTVWVMYTQTLLFSLNTSLIPRKIHLNLTSSRVHNAENTNQRTFPRTLFHWKSDQCLYEDFIRADARHYVCNSLLASLSGIRTIKCTLKFRLY